MGYQPLAPSRGAGAGALSSVLLLIVVRTRPPDDERDDRRVETRKHRAWETVRLSSLESDQYFEGPYFIVQVDLPCA